MKNRVIITPPLISGSRIDYRYTVEGEWKEAFKKEPFFIEYSRDISSVPDGITIIPLLAQILPIAWLYNAEIIMQSCDKAFYDSIDEFKKGYK